MSIAVACAITFISRTPVSRPRPSRRLLFLFFSLYGFRLAAPGARSSSCFISLSLFLSLCTTFPFLRLHSLYFRVYTIQTQLASLLIYRPLSLFFRPLLQRAAETALFPLFPLAIFDYAITRQTAVGGVRPPEGIFRTTAMATLTTQIL